jgi:uncharacterized protein (DUF3084 family)
MLDPEAQLPPDLLEALDQLEDLKAELEDAKADLASAIQERDEARFELRLAAKHLGLEPG